MELFWAALAIGCVLYLMWRSYRSLFYTEEEIEEIERYEAEIRFQRWKNGDPDWRGDNDDNGENDVRRDED